ncbi:MAG: hypothetical protein QXN66_06825 [Thermoplasmatales archaeon]
MSSVRLTGITGSSPLGVLALYGILTLCQEIPDLEGAKVFWQQKTIDGFFLDEPIAEIVVPGEIDEETLVEKLANHIGEKKTEYFEWSDDFDVRVKPEIFRDMIISKLENSSYNNREWVDWLAAFGSEVIVDQSKKLVKPTLFYMTSGQQKFLKILSEISVSMKKGTIQALHEAIFGPWMYRDPFHSLGWDPSTERLYAYGEKAPTSERPSCVKGAVYLASESLPMFPTIALPNGKLATVGFSGQGKFNNKFFWPLWDSPITIDALKSLLSSPELYDTISGKSTLIRRGVFAVYAAERMEFGKGYFIFRPSSVVWST